jgi:hypothetical protein
MTSAAERVLVVALDGGTAEEVPGIFPIVRKGILAEGVGFEQ